MAGRKKAEVQLLREVESQEEWEDIMSKDGLWVVDVYQEWSGPCEAMISNFRRVKNELGDDLLHFAMAKSDAIESLEKYRGRCEPCFLFFAGGVLVAYVHGANAPLILRTLTEQLTQEHKVLDGTTERKEVLDPFVTSREKEQKDEEEEEEAEVDEHERNFEYKGELIIYDDELEAASKEDYEEVEEGYTVALIKPNVVAAGKVDEVLAEMAARGIKVVAQESRLLTEDEVREFYKHLQGESYFEELVTFMSSGPCYVLVLTKGKTDDSIITDWRDMLGPPVVEEAKEQAPESLRAKYGAGGLMNALHGSDSKDTAARELAFFFPDMNAPTITKKKPVVQRTLALIRPDAFVQNRTEILAKITEAGFKVALQKEVRLTKEQAEEFYKEHLDQPYFQELVKRMSNGPLLALGLAREDAIGTWRSMLGPPNLEEAKSEAPDSLRAQFAVEDVPINQLHGSSDPQSAKEEIEFFFPVEQTVALIKPDAMGTKEAIINKIHEAGFKIAARKETVITKDIAESFYEDQKDKPYFNDLVEHMCSGPTMFMVLSREGAVEGWRQTIGPTDPETAKAEAPDSLRAQFGHDILKNAVHGCTSLKQAQLKIVQIFGNLEFNPDGTRKGEQSKEGIETVKAKDKGAADAKEPQEPQHQHQGESQAAEEQPATDEPPAPAAEGPKTDEPPAPAAEGPKTEEPQPAMDEPRKEKPADTKGDKSEEEPQSEEPAPAEAATEDKEEGDGNASCTALFDTCLE